MPLAAKVCGVSKSFGNVRALHEVDFDVPEGGVFGVIGANGAGKTTLMTLLQGFDKPDAGRLWVLNREPLRFERSERAQLGAQLDRGGLPPNLRAGEALAFFRGLYRFGENPRDLLAALGLEDAAGQLVRELSTGEHRRLAVAVALVGRPRLVFLDEPSLGLDPVGRQDLWRVLRASAARGATILLTTNAMEEAESLCDRLAFLREGRVEALGSPRALIEQYTWAHRVVFDTSIDAVLLAEIEGLRSVEEVQHESSRTILLSRDPTATIRELVALERQRLPRFQWVAPRLEDVFHEIGNRAPSDA